MSDEDGRSICRYLKSQDHTSHIPIIISANRDAKAIAIEAGANECAAKPFDVDDLLIKIRKYI